MSVNIAPLVTPTYDATVPVPADGEYANSAALQAMVLPVANRVEYLRQVLEDAPWREVSIFEDFLAPVHEVDADEYYADTAWVMNSAFSGYAKTSIPAFGDALGLIVASNSSGGALSALSRKTEGCIKVENFRRATARIQVGSVAAGMGFTIGLDFVGGAETMAAVFAPATSANWLLRDATGFLSVDTGVPVAINTWYTLDLVHDGALGFTLSVNGSVPVVANPAGLPALIDVVTPAWKMITPAAGANRFFYIDYIYFRDISAGRVV
jgi:hypothetical protein